MQDIATDIGRPQIEAVIDRFYDAIRAHPTLATPFAIVDDWTQHKALLTHFWWVSLGGERYMSYDYQVAAKHLHVGFTPELLEEWLTLFRNTIETHVEATYAALWIKRAELIGESLRLMHQFHGAT
ncbi:group III truncated hemoglobin [Leeia oryzae]|uniref:group III truncated hemoglobin n=1 Tax=Leeia oryzae TaxID=356662 RepID=UPI00035FBD16|nr:group III truncated hemoglobin [Leeia oryzae]